MQSLTHGLSEKGGMSLTPLFLGTILPVPLKDPQSCARPDCHGDLSRTREMLQARSLEGAAPGQTALRGLRALPAAAAPFTALPLPDALLSSLL